MDCYFDGMVNYLDRCREPRPSKYLGQLQRIIAQRSKKVYENLKAWYF
jgi:hypothetical protein